MLRRDPQDVRRGPTCRVVADRSGLTASDGAAHVLYCGPGPVPAGAFAIDAFELPAEYRVPKLHGPSPVDVSERVRHALARLHAEHRFGRIEFPTLGGLGFRTIQAKRAGLAFDGVALAVRLDTCAAWLRERAERWPGSYDEVEAEFAERFAFEHADVRETPDAELLAFVRRLGWSAEPHPELAAGPGGDPPLVTVGIAHHNLGRHLPETLASLAAQTYPHLEVIVIDDGSTDPASLVAFAEVEARYPHYRFLRQPNAGIGATRNRCLELARGEFFIPVDADNLARPDMVERFVAAIRRNPGIAAMTCYFLAFEDGAGNPPREFLHACRPAGGPHVLACIRNVYGDANAILRTAAFREVGGYETDRGTSCEDWEAFAKLVHAGKRVGVVPDHLFYYRHLPGGFSRRTNWYANHQRVLRQFGGVSGLPSGEGAALWTALLGFHLRMEQLTAAPTPVRHRIADAVHGALKRVLDVARFRRRSPAGTRTE